jgi:hypothetical protein
MLLVMSGNVLDPRQQQYLDWLCTAPSERVPTSKKKYADLYAVSLNTLHRWEKMESFRGKWQLQVEEIQGSPERTQSLLDTLYRNALAGDTKSASLWLQTTNRLKPSELVIKTVLSELTNEELDAAIKAAGQAEKDARRLEGGAKWLSDLLGDEPVPPVEREDVPSPAPAADVVDVPPDRAVSEEEAVRRARLHKPLAEWAAFLDG